MKTLLHIKSSIFGSEGQSAQLAETLISQWKLKHPAGEVVERDLVAENIPHMDQTVVTALRGGAAEHTAEHQAILQRSDELVAELKAADEVVIGLPFYNFNVPSQVKSYFDLLARAGVTFSYTENGPVGLIDDKPVYLITTRGGIYHETGIDFQIPFVKQFLGFIGLKNVEVVYAEGLAMGEIAEKALAEANAQIAAFH
ncbi:NAD(P)H-dependent oxidoreductase [uncultured Neptuniibacter sp.]|uniref:FMN-dependent NADH-azoreductase n=1 Tax=uncultured Neptuniibacter sp. TaxID=502143 RepID=UPI00263234E5|nr:NAD(P)H-dependent oxidoreductase [uncultured Neptuniibacter sp.]